MRKSDKRRKFGRVRIRKLPQSDSLPGLRASEYRWSPLKAIQKKLHKPFSLALNCATIPGKGRVFVPPLGDGVFILEASLGGALILKERMKLSEEQCFSYDVMRLFFQLAPRLREAFNREFKRESDLLLKNSEGGGTILPSHLGVTGTGRRWSPQRLIREGKTRAIELGYKGKELTQAAFIRLGLLEAARLNPIDVTTLKPEQALSIVRLGLFDLGPGQSPADPEIELVTERILVALKHHIDDDTDAFNEWFFDKIDNLVRQVSKKRRPGGPVAREQVRQVLLEHVFRSLVYMGQCIHVLLEDFARAIPKSCTLTDEEQMRLELLNRMRPWLGGLPLTLLRSRFSFLKEALEELAAAPDDPIAQGVFLRLLDYYGSMVNRRRQADRERKRRQTRQNKKGSPTRIEQIGEVGDVAKYPISAVLQNVAEALRSDRGIKCRCTGEGDFRAKLTRSRANKDRLILLHFCQHCEFEQDMIVNQQELQAIQARLVAED